MTTPQERSRRIGRDFESRCERLFEGVLHAGEDGDVDLPGSHYRLECKASVGLSNVKLKAWLDQIAVYEEMPKNKNTEFLLAFSGNKPYQNARVWVAMDHREFQRLLTLERRYYRMKELLGQGSVEERMETLTATLMDIAADIAAGTDTHSWMPHSSSGNDQNEPTTRCTPMGSPTALAPESHPYTSTSKQMVST
jgi:hypothetical protein